MSVGQDLLDVPFPQMVQNLAFAIARGQLALDRTSLATARALAQERVTVISELSEVIVPDPYDVNLPDGSTVRVTGARVQFDQSRPTSMTLLQAGLFPTFYQFTESVIEVKMSISQKTSSSSELEAGASLEVSGGFFGVSVAFASHVNYKHSQTFSYSAEGSSLLRTTLKPVPPPSRLTPRIVTVNTLAQPPVVTFA
jgi:hypothetical protein